MDPAVFDYTTAFSPADYTKGNMAESWEFTSPGIFVVHLRKGIHWQDIPPANGREFIADDVVFHFNRLFGLGGGFTTAAPYWSGFSWFKDLQSVTAADKYTVVFKWKLYNPELIMEYTMYNAIHGAIESPDAVAKWGDVTDWHHAIGTGPFILTDYVSASSLTLVKNPNYWGYDERYPQNKLPYIDTLTILIIPDDATAIAGLRTGKIDSLDQVLLNKAQSLQKTNPELLQLSGPLGAVVTLEPRNDKVPFNDIRVRKAMQMAIDLPTIAKTYYGGTADPYPSSLTPNCIKGWGFPYKEWPQDLKDEYAYNPTAAKKLLADAGYPNGFKTNVVADNTADIDLLQVVKSYFAAIGVDMEIRAMDSVAFSAFVKTSKKHDALAYRTKGALGKVAAPLTTITVFTTDYTENITMVRDPVYDDFYARAAVATSVDEAKQVLRDCNEYVARHHYAISLLLPNLFTLCQPWLKGYNGQAGTVFLSMLSFYCSRFWIDQNLKTSLGHQILP